MSESRSPCETAPAAGSRVATYAAVTFLVAITWIVFWRVSSFDFVIIDDGEYVAGNSHVGPLNLRNFKWAWTTRETANWHPLTWLSLILDAQLFGKHPGPFHRTNLVLHTINVLLLFGAFRELTGSSWKSLFVAALFAVHPLHVETVAWISDRKDLVCTGFGFAVLWTYAIYARRGGWRWYAFALALYVLSLLGKQMLVTWPFVFLLLDFWPLERFRAEGPRTAWSRLVREKAPFFAIAAIFCVVVYFAQRAGGAVSGLERYSLPVRLENAIAAYGLYLSKTFWPQNLAIFYPHPGATLPLAEILLAALVLAAVTVLAVWKRRSHPYLLVGWLWFLGMLVPVIGLVQVGHQQAADRYTYVPLVGLFLALVWLASAWGSPGAMRERALVVAGCLLIAGCMVISRRQTSYWSDSMTLFEHANAVTRPNAFAKINLGNALEQLGRKDEARTLYEQAVAVDPKSNVALDCLGEWWLAAGDANRAAEIFEQALLIEPRCVEIRLNLGASLAALGQSERALREFQSAWTVAPNSASTNLAVGNGLRALGRTGESIPFLRRAAKASVAPQPLVSLGAALVENGEAREAADCFSRAIEIDPNFGPAHVHLGKFYHAQGRYDDALDHFETASKLNPGDTAIQFNVASEHVNVGIRIANDGQLPLATESFRAALRVCPDHFMAHQHLARALAWQGDWAAAADGYRQAISLRPDSAEVHAEFGVLLARMNRKAEAQDELNEALRLNPELREAQQALQKLRTE